MALGNKPTTLAILFLERNDTQPTCLEALKA